LHPLNRWAQQFEPPLKNVTAGLQQLRPPGWPFKHAQPADQTPPSAAGTVNGVSVNHDAVNGGSVNRAVKESSVKIETSSAAEQSAVNDPAVQTLAVRAPNTAAVNTPSATDVHSPPALPCHVLVVTSPSGRAAIAETIRAAEYAFFSEMVHGIPWPLDESAGARDH
jgi:hypothetical protein